MVTTIICFDRLASYENWLKHQPANTPREFISLSSPLEGCSDDDRQRFLKDYVDLIGQLSVHNHSLLWWSTDISSKNRFFTPLESFLEQFFKIMWKVEKTAGDTLICIDVPWEITKDVKKTLIQKNIKFEWHGNPLIPVRLMLKEPALRLARIIRHIFYIIPRIIKAKELFGSLIKQAALDKTGVYVFKTFAAARSFDAKGGYKDLFFGILPEFMSSYDRTIILADVMDDFSKTASLIQKWGQGKIYPLEAFLRIRDVVFASMQMSKYSIRVPQELYFGTYNVSGLVKRVRSTYGCKIQPVQLYQYFMMKNFLINFKVKEFTFTCEFNPWEKICLWALGQHSSGVKTRGYQHTVVPHASANMFVSRFEQEIMPRPDVVLTVGQRPKEIIHRYETCTASPIVTACALRFEYFDYPLIPRTNRGHILLALEGLPQVAEMTDYVLKQIGGHQDYQIKIRTHPVLPLDKFVNQLCQDPRQMPGVTISKGTSLKDDLEWADIVIYWGTTVSLEAVSMGKPVIHYDIGSIVRYDPLFELNDFKWAVNRSVSLSQVIKTIYKLPDESYYEQRQKALQYIAGYFHRITPESLNLFRTRT